MFLKGDSEKEILKFKGEIEGVEENITIDGNKYPISEFGIQPTCQ